MAAISGQILAILLPAIARHFMVVGKIRDLAPTRRLSLQRAEEPMIMAQ
jgi:hypothetical protein